ncbi:phosphate ABC transporter substrate-binding protein (PhoT family) [Marinobacter persicus]|uniref:Phosphate ABC transporter substrate-binding protein (PhoT family) n=2 Tax=Marinobacter persicus TaxID=930118 RepID=A0A2S6G4V0_9GAMM|nr:MAG: Periplasmic phosphate binding protein(ABC superfamily, peri-bind) [Marinobacter sp. T13-3]PPK50727.1 phosphate ABC transporter substrate-binding protein (PhoT family) [Marinobacter persicus]PPK54125.1 phosphate ABC transporter substrate-binding protein (PhoT family) [Marinobacter persicus]PPK57312.1 phosphate ABC transporter substrate-binding protein (PhoT family) [Marinobacter persicus]
MKLKTALTSVALAGTIAAVSTPAMARDTISIVGSSTVYPFATVVAERFGTKTEYSTPKLESTGSGGGMKLFCQGIGTQHPDITNASRRMKTSEYDLCQKNGVTDITEFRIGSDGIVIASSQEAQNLDITLETLFLALGKKVPNPDNEKELIENPYEKWSDIDSSLPNVAIRVMGPPPTSGTRDSFNELALQGGCEDLPAVADMSEDDMEAVCQSVREDGAFIEAGENDNLIVQKLIDDDSLYGVFGYSFLEENSDRLQAATLNGVVPTVEAIAADEYPVARSLFFYVKKAHIGVIPGIKGYIEEFVSPAAMGRNGYLKSVGLIVPPREALMDLQDKAANMPNLQKSELL